MKKASSLLSSLFLVLVMHQAVAQDSLRYSTLGFSVGAGQVFNKDQFQSPFTYKGNSLVLQANYTRSNVKGQHAVEGDYSTGSFKSVISPIAQNQLIVLRYTYLFRLGKSRTPWAANVGAGVSTLGNSTNYLPGIELPKSYLTSSTAITFNGLFSYVPKTNHRLILKATIPMASYVYRPDFDVNGKSRKGFTTIAEDLGLIANLAYEYRLKRNYKLVLNYQYTYFTYDKPRTIAILQNDFTIGFKKQL